MGARETLPARSASDGTTHRWRSGLAVLCLATAGRGTRGAVMPRNGVSIVIPNWNHELLLPRSISSGLAAVRCLAGENVPAEVMVIDDCSRDGSLTLLRNLEAVYYEDGFRVLARSTNGGLAAARNLGLVHARHRYVIFM